MNMRLLLVLLGCGIVLPLAAWRVPGYGVRLQGPVVSLRIEDAVGFTSPFGRGLETRRVLRQETVFTNGLRPVLASWYARDGRLVSRSTWQYDKDGRLVERLRKPHGRSLPERLSLRFDESPAVLEKVLHLAGKHAYFRSRYRYDDGGRIAGESLLREDGSMLLHGEYRYGQDEQADSIRFYQGDGTPVFALNQDYDSEGRLTAREWRDAAGELLGGPVFLRDEKGRLLTRLERGGAAGFDMLTRYRYDDAGRLIASARYRDQTTLLGERLREYRPDGRLLAVEERDGDGLLLVRKEYDGQGLLLNRQSYRHGQVVTDKVAYRYDGERRFERVQQGADGVFLTRYHYDGRGNPLRQERFRQERRFGRDAWVPVSVRHFLLRYARDRRAED
jgi:YD repeat-containing protein